MDKKLKESFNRVSVPARVDCRFRETSEDVFVWEAVTTLLCGQCNRTIQIGEFFSRSADKKGLVYGIRYVNCRNCAPFEPVLQWL